MIPLDEQDNTIIRTHLYEANKHLPVHEKVAMNVFVIGIDIEGDEIRFHHVVTEPILDDECGVTRDMMADECYDPKEIGRQDVISINLFSDPIKVSLMAAVRDIQIRRREEKLKEIGI